MKAVSNKSFIVIIINVLLISIISIPNILTSYKKSIAILVIASGGLMLLLLGALYYKHSKKESINYKALFFVTFWGIFLYILIKLFAR